MPHRKTRPTTQTVAPPSAAAAAAPPDEKAAAPDAPAVQTPDSTSVPTTPFLPSPDELSAELDTLTGLLTDLNRIFSGYANALQLPVWSVPEARSATRIAKDHPHTAQLSKSVALLDRGLGHCLRAFRVRVDLQIDPRFRPEHCGQFDLIVSDEKGQATPPLLRGRFESTKIFRVTRNPKNKVGVSTGRRLWPCWQGVWRICR